MAMEKFRAPPLPAPPTAYDQRYVMQLIRALGLYFDKLDSKTPQQADSYRAGQFLGGAYVGETVDVGTVTFTQAVGGDLSAQYATTWGLNTQQVVAGSVDAQGVLAVEVTAGEVHANHFHGSGRFLETPYNQLESRVDQTAAAIDAAYAVQFEVDVFPNGISVQSGSQITFSSAGVYRLDYSLSFRSESNEGEFIDVWLRYNGTDIPDSNSRFFISARKSITHPSYLIATTPLMVEAHTGGDYVEIMWHVSSTQVTMRARPAQVYSLGVTPTIPLTPSAIVQVQFVSAEFPLTKTVGVLPVVGFGQVGNTTVVTT